MNEQEFTSAYREHSIYALINSRSDNPYVRMMSMSGSTRTSPYRHIITDIGRLVGLYPHELVVGDIDLLRDTSMLFPIFYEYDKLLGTLNNPNIGKIVRDGITPTQVVAICLQIIIVNDQDKRVITNFMKKYTDTIDYDYIANKLLFETMLGTRVADSRRCRVLGYALLAGSGKLNKSLMTLINSNKTDDRVVRLMTDFISYDDEGVIVSDAADIVRNSDY